MKDETLYNYFNGQATPEEVGHIAEWLTEDSAHQKEYDSAHMLFNAMALHESGYGEKKAAPVIPVKRPVFRTFARIAAAVAVVAGAWYAGMFIEKEIMYRDLSTRMSAVEVPAGQRMSLTLSDGTEVCLNGGSRLEYPLVFDRKTRRVNLSGEAFLTVKHDEKHPFVVETFASNVEVLGTEFNVYADEETNSFSATLLNGKVRVSTLGEENDQVTLSPDERAEFIDNHLVVSKVSAADFVSWVDGYVNLGGADFEELMCRFENVYGVDIIIDRKDSLGVGYQSGKIRVAEGVDFALHLLQEAYAFSYEKNPETNTITIR
ncbi:MAG: FecR domain-containing protein [Bacteroidales bacterium]|nr:FecR domain-containing protein [Bacteroidales bacterium]